MVIPMMPGCIQIGLHTVPTFSNHLHVSLIYTVSKLFELNDDIILRSGISKLTTYPSYKQLLLLNDDIITPVFDTVHSYLC